MKRRILLLPFLCLLGCDDDGPAGAEDAAGDPPADAADVAGDAAGDAVGEATGDPAEGDPDAAQADSLEDLTGDPEVGNDTPDLADDGSAEDALDSPDLPAEDAADAALGEGECHETTDCDSSSESCLPPGAFIGCGIVREPDPSELCAEDEECGDDQICELSGPEACFEFPQEICQPACAGEDDCAINEFCAPDGRCVPDPCLQLGSSDGCPAHFVCRAGEGFDEGNPRCLRRPCDEQADCPAGHCVEGFCYAEPGSCVLPVP